MKYDAYGELTSPKYMEPLTDMAAILREAGLDKAPTTLETDYGRVTFNAGATDAGNLLDLLKEARAVLRDYRFSYDEEGEEYNNDDVIAISRKIDDALARATGEEAS